jgi:hypothetical protein
MQWFFTLSVLAMNIRTCVDEETDIFREALVGGDVDWVGAIIVTVG